MDITSAEITLFQILGGSGRRVITSRGIVRASGSDEILEPGCTLQAKAGAVQNLTPWDGSSVPMGVLLEGVTAGAVAQQCRILATGPVKNEHIYIYSALLGKIKPNAGQWAILHASHIVPVGTEYAEVGAVGGTCLDGAEAPLNGATVTISKGDYSKATTSAAGAYVIADVPVGTGYTVTVSKTGYTDGVYTEVAITENVTTVKNVVAVVI